MKNYVLIVADTPPPPYYNESTYTRGPYPQQQVKKQLFNITSK